MIMHTHRLIWLLPLALSFTSCGPLDSRADQKTLEKNRDKWRSKGADTYYYEYRQLCFCAIEYADWAGVYVFEDAVEEVTILATDEPPTMLGLVDYRIIEDLFRIAENAIDEADKYDIEYDQEYGYPTKIEADFYKNAVDDEVTYLARNLIFPQEILQVLVRHMKKPKASTYADPELVQVLRQFDRNNADLIPLDVVGEGDLFEFNKKMYRKLKLRRTRVLCQLSDSKRKYLISKSALVRVLQTGT